MVNLEKPFSEIFSRWRNVESLCWLHPGTFTLGRRSCLRTLSNSGEAFVSVCLSWWRTELQPHGDRAVWFRDTDDVLTTGGAEVSQGDAKARLLRFLGLLLPCGDDYRTEQDEDQRNICTRRRSCHICCNQGEKLAYKVGRIYLTNNPAAHVLCRCSTKSSIIIWCVVTC